MVGAARLDVYLESFDGTSPEHREGANSLKVGDKLRLQEALADEQPEGGDSTPEGLLLVVTGEGGHVGHVKQSLLQGKTFMTLCATVRSIKRDKETSEVLQVQVRITEGAQLPPPPPLQDQQEDEEEGTWTLSKAQLDLLASSEEVQQLLRDERLRGVISSIDSADDRHKELLSQLGKDPAFKAVCHQMIDTMTPEEAA